MEKEPIWIPGERFEAEIDSDLRIATIQDRKSFGRMRQLDYAGLGHLLNALEAALRGMAGVGPAWATTGRFVASVSMNRLFADILDSEGEKTKSAFITMNSEEVEELKNLILVVLESMENSR